MCCQCKQRTADMLPCSILTAVTKCAHFFPGSPVCPVAAFKLYISKLNKKDQRMWQKPKNTDLRYEEDEWFYGLPVGHDPLEMFMCHLSIKLELTDIYTNHCIRATCMQALDDAGYQARHYKYFEFFSAISEIFLFREYF